LRPDSIQAKVSKNKDIREASDTLKAKEEQYKQLKVQEKQAQQDRANWQEKHSLRSKLSKLIGSQPSYLIDKDALIDKLQNEQKKLASDILASQNKLAFQKEELGKKYLPSHERQLDRANAIEQLAKEKAREETRQRPDRERSIDLER